MWKTAVLLLITLIIIPVLTCYMDIAPYRSQWEILKSTYAVCLVFIGLAFIVSSITDNYSQVDKLWSILPVVYAWMVYSVAPGSRVLLMAILITLWGIRLTLNFGRRGGYSLKFWSGEEDYRWSILRAKPEFSAKWKWILFNFFFISFYQMSLIWMLTIPLVRSANSGPIGWPDYILAAVAIGLLIMETIADQQQWDFQKKKYRLKAEGKLSGTKYEKGFVHDGLWGLSRHPNYFAEQAFWVVIFFFSVAATGTLANWSIAGCLLLILLFRGSSNFSEQISSSRYPEYEEYKKKVPRFIPSLKV